MALLLVVARLETASWFNRSLGAVPNGYDVDGIFTNCEEDSVDPSTLAIEKLPHFLTKRLRLGCDGTSLR
jgi:hypothetical protein